MDLLGTIIAGVLVFVFSQVVLEFWVRPFGQLRNSISLIGQLLLVHQSKVLNPLDESESPVQYSVDQNGNIELPEVSKTLPMEMAGMALANRSRARRVEERLEVGRELRRLGAEALANANAIPFYDSICRTFGFPWSQDILVAAQELNVIAHNLVLWGGDESSVHKFGAENVGSLKIVSSKLGIRTEYAA